MNDDSIFGIAKTCATEMCRNLAFQQNIPFINAYISKMFGHGEKYSSAPVKIINQLLENQPAKLTKGDQYDDWTYIDDVVEGLMAVAIVQVDGIMREIRDGGLLGKSVRT